MQNARLWLWGLAPAAILGLGLGLFALTQQEWGQKLLAGAALLALVLLALPFLWLAFLGIGVPKRPYLDPRVQTLQERVGGELVNGALRLQRDGIAVEVRIFWLMVGIDRKELVPIVSIAEPDSWTLLALGHPTFQPPKGFSLLLSGHTLLDQQIAWFSDRPEEAAVWLADPEVPRTCNALLQALNSRHEQGPERFTHNLEQLISSRKALSQPA